MNNTPVVFDVREFRPEDQPQVVALLRQVLDRPGQGVHDDAYFRWKHLDGPFGASVMLVADAGGKIVGFRAFMRWRLEFGGRIIEAGRPVDTVTDPAMRRQGVFSTLTKTALRRIDDLGIEMLFNTPNEQSLPGYLKMGWTPLGRATRDVLIGGPAVLARSALARVRRQRTGPVTRGGNDTSVWERLAAALRDPSDRRIKVMKDAAYLRWRYARHPWFRYDVIGPPETAAVVRTTTGRRLPMAVIAESTGGTSSDWARLLTPVVAETAAPIVQYLHTRASAAPHAWGWMRLVRTGPMVVCRGDEREMLDLNAWSFVTGELEFF